MVENVAMTHFTLGAVTVAAIQWLKSSSWFPWITAGKTNLIRFVSAMAAAGSAVGISYTWNPTDHSLTIVGLTLTGMVTAGYAWLKQFAVQEFMYRATAANRSNGTNGAAKTPVPAGFSLGKTAAPAVVLLLCTFGTFVLAGCAPHVAPTAGVPGRNATPTEKALAYNASLADANRTIANSVIAANNQTPPLLSTDAANRILIMQSRVADFDRQLTPLIGGASTITVNSARISMLLDEIKRAAQGVQGDLGIQNPGKQKEVAGAITQVYQMADLILTTLTAAGLVK